MRNVCSKIRSKYFLKILAIFGRVLIPTIFMVSIISCKRTKSLLLILDQVPGNALKYFVFSFKENQDQVQIFISEIFINWRFRLISLWMSPPSCRSLIIIYEKLKNFHQKYNEPTTERNYHEMDYENRIFLSSSYCWECTGHESFACIYWEVR